MNGTSDDPRDPLDDTLARGLRALAPSEFELDAESALGAMRPGLRRARARRRVATATSALGVLAVFAAGAAVLRHHPDSHVNVRSHAPSTVSTPAPAPHTSTTRRPPPTPTTNAAPNTPTSTRRPTPTSGGASHPTVPVLGPTTPPPAPTPTTVPTGRPEPSTTSTTIARAPATKTYLAIGGRATITFASGRLTLDSYAATAGYTTEIHTRTASEIEVRFNGDGHSSRIRVRVQDGRLEPEIQED